MALLLEYSTGEVQRNCCEKERVSYNSKAEKVNSTFDFSSLVLKLYLDEKNILILRENYEQENSNVTFQ